MRPEHHEARGKWAESTKEIMREKGTGQGAAGRCHTKAVHSWGSSGTSAGASVQLGSSRAERHGEGRGRARLQFVLGEGLPDTREDSAPAMGSRTHPSNFSPEWQSSAWPWRTEMGKPMRETPSREKGATGRRVWFDPVVLLSKILAADLWNEPTPAASALLREKRVPFGPRHLRACSACSQARSPSWPDKGEGLSSCTRSTPNPCR